MQSCFAGLGLTTEYGGPHSNGITHMALLGFDDGSYLELISTREPGAQSPLWNSQIHANAGPAAWAVRVDDLNREQARLARAGVTARDPLPMTRNRPDGTALAWEVLFPGDAPPGATLPFAIRDRTARELRVSPSPSVAGSGIRGIGTVVLGVASISATAALFHQAYGSSNATILEWEDLGVRLGRVSDAPVLLAEPLTTTGWLPRRIAEYGNAPAAVLLDCDPAAAIVNQLPLLAARDWFGDQIRWIDPARLFGWRVGLIFGTR
jgi:hypothetical protein